jgi:hypothetical protein
MFYAQILVLKILFGMSFFCFKIVVQIVLSYV